MPVNSPSQGEEDREFKSLLFSACRAADTELDALDAALGVGNGQLSVCYPAEMRLS